MRKLFFDKINDAGEITITGDDHKHIAFSLRMRPGDEIVICAGGVDYTAKLRDICKDKTVAEIVGMARCVSEPVTDITLFFGALKGDKNDYVVQKCTELGIKKFVPFISAYSSVREDNVKSERLGRIALEAAKQSGRGCVPELSRVVDFNDLLDMLKDYELIVFPYEHEEQTSLDAYLACSGRGKTAVVVGSEGGFSVAEAEKIRKLCGKSVTLGKRILRADTACVAVCSALMFALGEWGGEQ